MTTTYTWTTTRGICVETFDPKGYVTLHRNGSFVYEHQFSTIGVQLQEMELKLFLSKRDIEFSIN
jgi:hypothetical protein